MPVEKIREILKIYLKKALYSSDKFIKLIFSDDKTDYEIQSAITHLNQAFTCIQLANIQYLTYCENGECNDFEEVVQAFNVFNHEFLSSYSTNHDLQWTSIEYYKFKEECENFLTNY